MGTSLENVLEDIESLREHLEYFAMCGEFPRERYRERIIAAMDILKELANNIDEGK